MVLNQFLSTDHYYLKHLQKSGHYAFLHGVRPNYTYIPTRNQPIHTALGKICTLFKYYNTATKAKTHATLYAHTTIFP